MYNEKSLRGMRQFLAEKYSQAKNYFYTKPINEFIHNARTTQNITFYAKLNYYDDSEHFRRFYYRNEQLNKMYQLSEYYKFHNEIPRLFMSRLSDLMNNYHDKKRGIEYYKILKQIEDENKQHPDRPKKTIVGDKPPSLGRNSIKQEYGKMLQDLSENSTTIETLNRKLKDMKFPKDELNLLPSTREQEQLNEFVKFMTQTRPIKQNTLMSPPQSATRMTHGVGQKAFKQMLQRKVILQKQNISISPRQTIQSFQKVCLIEEPKKPQSKIGSQTHRVFKQSLGRVLNSPVLQQKISFDKDKVITSARQTKSSFSINKKLSFAEPMKPHFQTVHQHTRSDFKLIKK